MVRKAHGHTGTQSPRHPSTQLTLRRVKDIMLFKSLLDMKQFYFFRAAEMKSVQLLLFAFFLITRLNLSLGGNGDELLKQSGKEGCRSKYATLYYSTVSAYMLSYPTSIV